MADLFLFGSQTDDFSCTGLQEVKQTTRHSCGEDMFVVCFAS